MSNPKDKEISDLIIENEELENRIESLEQELETALAKIDRVEKLINGPFSYNTYKDDVNDYCTGHNTCRKWVHGRLKKALQQENGNEPTKRN